MGHNSELARTHDQFSSVKLFYQPASTTQMTPPLLLLIRSTTTNAIPKSFPFLSMATLSHKSSNYILPIDFVQFTASQMLQLMFIKLQVSLLCSSMHNDGHYICLLNVWYRRLHVLFTGYQRLIHQIFLLFFFYIIITNSNKSTEIFFNK